MGRDVAGLRVDKKPITVDVKSNGTNHNVAQVPPNKVETENHEPQDNKQDLGDTENTNQMAKEKTIKVESDDSSNTSPNATSTSQTNFHKDSYDEDDNCSIDSSYSATSLRSNKFRVTVPVAPRFICEERLERRKEYYAKLEEKHKAMEREKLELEAKKKEEEQEAIKQLRKSMVYKANPIPSFYREGPPKKVELKKPPVTRAKSPKLTRRRSCGDAGKHSPYEAGLNEQATHHSISSTCKEGKSSGVAAKGKNRIAIQKSNNENARGKAPDEHENAENDAES